VLEQDRCALRIDRHDNILQVLKGVDITDTADHELRFAHFDESAAHVVIRALNRALYVLERQPIGPQPVGGDFDLVLLDKPANAGHLGHARHRGEFIA
jgi:hypothetical protein